MNKTVFTPNALLSFADLTVAKPDQNGQMGFRAELMFPKTIRMSELAEMKALHDGAIRPAWVAAGEQYRAFEKCFIDGNTKKQDGRKGKWLLHTKAGTDFPPRLKMWDNKVAKGSDLYPGANVRALLSVFSWEGKNKEGIIISRGVSFNLLVVQLLNLDGERLGANFVSDEEIEEALAARPLAHADGEELLG